jgi:hypothetical protein
MPASPSAMPNLATHTRWRRFLTELGYPSTGDEVIQRLAYWLPDPMSRILIAEHHRRLIGCLSLHAIPYLERTGRWARSSGRFLKTLADSAIASST